MFGSKVVARPNYVVLDHYPNHSNRWRLTNLITFLTFRNLVVRLSQDRARAACNGSNLFIRRLAESVGCLDCPVSSACRENPVLRPKVSALRQRRCGVAHVACSGMPTRPNDFQNLITMLTQVLGDNAVVEESKLLTDLVSGEQREVDIYGVGTLAGHSMRIAIEYKDNQRKQGVEWVEQLRSKHESLPTDLLILVSSSGFTNSAVAMADRYGIKTITLTRADSDLASEVQESLRSAWGGLPAFVSEQVPADVGTSLRLRPRGPVLRARLEPKSGAGDIHSRIFWGAWSRVYGVPVLATAAGGGVVTLWDGRDATLRNEISTPGNVAWGAWSGPALATGGATLQIVDYGDEPPSPSRQSVVTHYDTTEFGGPCPPRMFARLAGSVCPGPRYRNRHTAAPARSAGQ
jgi:Restriction endonuclease